LPKCFVLNTLQNVDDYPRSRGAYDVKSNPKIGNWESRVVVVV